MLCWCKLCRKWFDQYHFLLPGGSWNGCGNGRDDIRYHPENPLCGDIWRLKDGRYLVVDYIDPLQVGVTFSDGTAGSVKYRSSFRQHVEGCELISTFEEWPFRFCDHRGWTREQDKATVANSLAFLKRVLDAKKKANEEYTVT